MSDQAYQIFQREIISMVKLTIFTGVSCCAFLWILNKLDLANMKKPANAKKKGAYLMKQIGKNQLKLTENELLIASHIVTPNEIDVSWKDIAGLEGVLDDIAETVIFPIQKSKLLADSRLTKPPKGVLLHGPPGCGKTLIAKATAKEAATTFINLDISILTDKWYGESQKLVSALFSLAEKIQPCIIFIDEIDSLLRTRTLQDHEASAMVKAQFMYLWDGLITDSDKIIIIMGATNRPQDLDKAILRRMPAAFRIPMPNKTQRIAILKLILEKEVTDKIDYESIGNGTEGFSGADLHELCRVASLSRVREYAKKLRANADMDENESIKLRSITMADLDESLKTMRGSKTDFLIGPL